MADRPLLFQDYPDDSAVWVFATNRGLSLEESRALLDSVRTFQESWTSHDRPVVSEAGFIEDRFLVVAAHIPDGDISGCGIDKLAHATERASEALGFSWLGGLDVVFRDSPGEIVCASRSEFRDRVKAGDIDEDTRVFDTSPSRLDTYRARGLEQRAGDSWHGRVFQLNTLTGA